MMMIRSTLDPLILNIQRNLIDMNYKLLDNKSS